MSYILFADEQTEARISGRERAYLGQIVMNFPFTFMHPGWDTRCERLMPGMTRDADPARWERQFRTCWATFSSVFRDASGGPINPMEVSMNTIGALGSDEMRVAAWIHGQCEVHGWVEGNARAWLAARIERGMAIGIFRADPVNFYGWRHLVGMLRASTTLPVVMSYSVTNYFPAPPEGLSDGERDQWYAMAEDDKWKDGLHRLRVGEGNVGELVPALLAQRRYGDGRTILGILNEFGDERVI